MKHTLLYVALVLCTLSSSAAAGRRQWTYETLGAVWAAPLVGRDGRIYVSSEDATFYAFEPGGRVDWTYKASEGFCGWPVLLDARTIAVASRNGTLYLFSLGGELAGKVSLGGAAPGRPAVGRGALYLGTESGRVVAVNRDRLLWSHPAGKRITGWPVTAPSGRVIYAGTDDGTVLALDAAGNRLWRASLGSAIRPGMVAVGKSLLVATESEVVALGEGGKTDWRRPYKKTTAGLSALGPGAVLATEEGNVIALDAAARVLWRFSAGEAVRSWPSVTSDAVVVGTEGGTVLLLSHRGEPSAALSAAGAIRGAAVVAGGRILFGAQDRRVYAFLDPRSAERSAGWSGASALKARLRSTPQARLIWRRDLSGPVARGVTAGPGQSLLAPTWGRRLFALGPRGEIQWSYNCADDVDTLPAVGGKGTIVFGCGDGGFYGLSPDGDLRFRYPVNKTLASSPAVARDGTIYFGAGDQRIYSLDPRGKVLWRVRTGDDVDSAPRIGPDGMVYVGSDDRHLYAVSPLGTVTWEFRTGGAVRSRPAVDRNGVYVTSLDQSIYALSPDGAERWSYQTDGQIASSPLASSDGSLYFGSRDHCLHAVDANGKLRWRFESAGEVDSDPELSPGGDVVFGSDDGNVYALSSDGRLRWWYGAGAEVRGRILPQSDGSVVFGTMDGSVMRVQPPAAGAGSSSASQNQASAPGGIAWRATIGRGRGGPAVSLEGSLIIAGEDGVVRALGADHWPSWSVRVGPSALSAPLLVGRGVVVTDRRGHLALIRDGQLRFRLHLDRGALTEPAVLESDEGPLLLAGAPSGRLWAVTPAGRVRWFFSGGGPLSARPTVLGRGRSATIVVTTGREVVALDPAGERRFTATQPAGIIAGPVALGRAAVFGDGHGALRALGADGRLIWQRQIRGGIVALVGLPDQSGAGIITADGRLLEIAADGTVVLDYAARLPIAAAQIAGDLSWIVTLSDQSVWMVDRRTGLGRRQLELAAPARHLAAAPAAVVVISADGQVVSLSGTRVR